MKRHDNLKIINVRDDKHRRDRRNTARLLKGSFTSILETVDSCDWRQSVFSLSL